MNHMEVANRKESNRRKTKASLNNSMRGEVNGKMSMEGNQRRINIFAFHILRGYPEYVTIPIFSI